MTDCKHYVGMLIVEEDNYIVTLNDLLKHIESLKEMKTYDDNFIYIIYSMKDYCDSRKTTNLERFNYCPKCGEKINWKKLKEDYK